jgi:hypothetical protein
VLDKQEKQSDQNIGRMTRWHAELSSSGAPPCLVAVAAARYRCVMLPAALVTVLLLESGCAPVLAALLCKQKPRQYIIVLSAAVVCKRFLRAHCPLLRVQLLHLLLLSQLTLVRHLE